MIGHPLHAQCQDDGDNSRQAFRNRSHGEADRGHEHIEHVTAHQDALQEDNGTDREADDA